MDKCVIDKNDFGVGENCQLCGAKVRVRSPEHKMLDGYDETIRCLSCLEVIHGSKNKV